MHNVHAYIAYTTLNKLLAVFVYIMQI